MKSLSVFARGVILAAFLFAASTQAQAQTDAANPATPLYTSFETIERLQQGGYVMVIRHERTEYPSRADDYSALPTECRAQRNLSAAGVVSVHENGQLIRAAAIPVMRVITSPMCRASETARYLFGSDYETDARLMHHEPGEMSKRSLDQAASETAAAIRELAPLPAGSNVAVISHGGNIFKGTGLRLSEGEVGVLQIDEIGAFTLIGQFTGGTLGFYVRMKEEEAKREAGESE
ncbi:MAG: hypothetical protein AAF559_12470 [Pseudomonadota bacterium]